MTAIPTPLLDDHLLNTDQVSHLTGIAKPTLEGWRCRKNGGPPHIKLGPQIIRYRWGTLRQWIEKNTSTTAA